MTVQNGVVLYNGVIIGSVARLVCVEGYVASSESGDRILPQLWCMEWKVTGM